MRSVVRRHRSGLLPLLVAVGVACGSGGGTPAVRPPTAPAPTPAPPVPPPLPPVDTTGWIVAETGTAPLVLIAPHGGDLAPSTLPDRTCGGCETVNDANTQELARAIVAAFEARTGRRPFLVINRLHRRKFDANRELSEATAGYAPLEPMWLGFHLAIDSAKARALRVAPRALVLDLHGHAHSIARLELGYLATATQLRLGDAALDAVLPISSIAQLNRDSRSAARGAALLRGPTALGSLLSAAGVRAVPSAAEPAPATGEDYFNGGYNTQRHGSLGGGMVDAIQIEHHSPGLRDTAANRAAYAAILAEALATWLRVHYGWMP